MLVGGRWLMGIGVGQLGTQVNGFEAGYMIRSGLCLPRADSHLALGFHCAIQYLRPSIRRNVMGFQRLINCAAYVRLRQVLAADPPGYVPVGVVCSECRFCGIAGFEVLLDEYRLFHAQSSCHNSVSTLS